MVNLDKVKGDSTCTYDITGYSQLPNVIPQGQREEQLTIEANPSS